MIRIASTLWAWRLQSSSMKQNREFKELYSINVSLSPSISPDSCVREITLDCAFVVDALRGELDRPLACYGEIKIEWNNDIPTKVSCFVWHANFNRFPPVDALLKRGVQIDSTSVVIACL
ncbi:hypothetical protein LXL04_024458 [Taraxacum kok-saghyz]